MTYPLLLREFDAFPEEAELVGRLLASYSELEVALLSCVEHVQTDFGTAVKVMYRARGETQRIDVADALARLAYRRLGIGTQFEMAVGGLRHCLRIRNQFSHCVWHANTETKKLGFVNLEEVAREHGEVGDFRSMNVRRVDVALLGKQASYFQYVFVLIHWVTVEGETRQKKRAHNPLQCPPQQEPPDLHIS